jgi:ferredoxin
MRIKLDRTVCDGFGFCAKHAPEYFALDDWGYASLVGNGDIPEQDQNAVMRALLDCPVHAILKIDEYRPPDGPPHEDSDTLDESKLKTEDNEAEWGFVR